jgi:hypothetical protein
VKVRELTSAVYWVLVGGLIGFACCFGLFGLPFLATGWLLGIVGLSTLATTGASWTISGAWAITVGFGGAPAFLFLMSALEDRYSPLPPCNQMEPKEGIVVVAGCTPSTFDYIVLLMFFVLMALSGPAWRVVGLMRRRTSDNLSFSEFGE